MFDIAKYLEKFRLISNSHSNLIIIVKETIKEVCDIDLEKKKIFFKEGIIRVNERPIIKTVIFLKKQEILEEVNKKAKTKVRDLL